LRVRYLLGEINEEDWKAQLHVFIRINDLFTLIT